MDHNRVHLIGRLTNAPKLIPAGRRGPEHCTGTLAINRVVPNQAGGAADHIPFSIWGPEARNFIARRQKGDECCLLGRIRTNFVPQADQTQKFFWEVRIDIVQYGRQALRNLNAPPREETLATRAVATLTAEFGDPEE